MFLHVVLPPCLWLAVACLRVAQMMNPGPPENVARVQPEFVRLLAIAYPGSASVACLNVVGLLCLMIAVLNFVPDHNRIGIRSDGGKLLDVAIGKEAPSLKPLKPTDTSIREVPGRTARGDRGETEPIEGDAIVEFPPPTCRPPDGPIS